VFVRGRSGPRPCARVARRQTPDPAAPPTSASAARHTSIRICVRHLDDDPPTAIRLDPATHPRARRSGRYRASRDRTVSMASTARSLSTAWIAITGMYSSSGKSIRAQR
jgi:hypothetical protein